jgi:hypothetical protein
VLVGGTGMLSYFLSDLYILAPTLPISNPFSIPKDLSVIVCLGSIISSPVFLTDSSGLRTKSLSIEEL